MVLNMQPILLQRMKKIVAGILLLFFGLAARPQDSNITATDTTVKPVAIPKPFVQKKKIVHRDTASAKDSTLRNDSVSITAIDAKPTISVFAMKTDTPFFAHHPFFRFTNPMRYSVTVKKWLGKEAVFYGIIALLIFFALVRNAFPKYLPDLLKSFFQTTVKQRQVKEQLLQNPLPSLLLNLFFTFSAGMFLALLFQYFKWALNFNFWLLYLYCVLGLISIYAVKFVSLKFFGWLFQVSEPVDAYIFIVFSTNKIAGIFLLPLLVIISFTSGAVHQAAVSLGIMVLIGLFAYRFFLSFIAVRRQIRISFFHFLLYLCAFEIIPLLLINKVLFRFLAETS